MVMTNSHAALSYVEAPSDSDKPSDNVNKWRNVCLRSLLTQPATYGVVKAGKFVASGIPMVRGGDIKQGRISTNLPRISHEKDEEYSRTRLKADDVVIALVGYPGEAAVVPSSLIGANVSRAVGLLRPTARIDPQYLAAYLNSPIGRSEFLKPGAGSAQLVVNLRDLNLLNMPLPSLSEQRAIAAAVTHADEWISTLEQLIEKKRLIKQGAMQELLSGCRRLPGFTGEWEKRSFGGVFGFLPTATNSRADLSPEGDAYYVHYGDIHTRFHSHLDFGASELPRIVREKCPRAATLRNGDWIMADASEDTEGVGKAVEVRGLSDNEPAVSGLHTFLLREKVPVFVPGFKGHLGDAEFLRKQYLRVMTGMKVFGVSKTALRELVIPVPSSKEQEALVEVFDDMNADIAILEARLEKARLIKQAMMQELLTGRVRLV